MSSYPVKGTITQRKSKNLQDLYQYNHLDESLRLIDQLFESRLIDRIARPIDKKVKEEYIDQYKEKLNTLHERLKKIMNDASEKGTTSTINTKGKSNLGSTSIKPQEWTKYIRNIETRYTQVLVDGSFKYLQKICQMLAIKYDNSSLQTINIQQWSYACLHTKTEDQCC